MMHEWQAEVLEEALDERDRYKKALEFIVQAEDPKDMYDRAKEELDNATKK
jgi:hypothetical protein